MGGLGTVVSVGSAQDQKVRIVSTSGEVNDSSLPQSPGCIMLFGTSDGTSKIDNWYAGGIYTFVTNPEDPDKLIIVDVATPPEISLVQDGDYVVITIQSAGSYPGGIAQDVTTLYAASANGPNGNTPVVGCGTTYASGGGWTVGEKQQCAIVYPIQVDTDGNSFYWVDFIGSDIKNLTSF
jgi:hypothetical protein